MKPIHHAGPQREGFFFMEKHKESRKVFLSERNCHQYGALWHPDGKQRNLLCGSV